jgi:hypothetical protein
MNNFRHYQATVTMFCEGMTGIQTVRFPLKTRGYKQPGRSVTLAKRVGKSVEKRLKGVKIDGVILYPLTGAEIWNRYGGTDEHFPLFSWGKVRSSEQ